MMVRNRELTMGDTDSSSRFHVAAMTVASKKGAHQMTSVQTAPARDVYGARRKTTSEAPATRKIPVILPKKARMVSLEAVTALIKKPEASAASRMNCRRLILRTIWGPSASQREGIEKK